MTYRLTETLLGACAASSLAASAFAAPQTPATTPLGLPQTQRAQAFATLPNWSGTWLQSEPAMFEPATVKGQPGVPGNREHPPYNAVWEKKYDDILAHTVAGYFSDPITNCQPHGMPRLMGGSIGAVEFVVTPEQTWIVWEWGIELRRIYTDGRGHPPADELYPLYNGDSIGHWEGQTLVVDTVSMRDDTPYDRTGAPHSDQVHMTERLRLTDPTHIENDITVEDPVAFTRPWHVVRHYYHAPKDRARIIDAYCNEATRENIVNGQTQLHLPSDPPGYVMGALPLDKPVQQAPSAAKPNAPGK